MRTFLLILLTGSGLIQMGQAQMDSIVWPLPMAHVIEERTPAMHYDLFKADSTASQLTPLFFTTSELLEFNSAAYLRDYGNQTLSTLSVRGGSSQQTEILWNGARISNPMLGLGDISMLPLMFFTDVDLQSHQQNGVYNPIGGALALNSQLEDSSFYAFGISGGQFGEIRGIGQAQFNLGRHIKARVQAFSHSDNQNFPYQEEHASILLPNRQPHASYLQQGILGQLSYSFAKHHTLFSSLWMQGSKREIPPLITQSRSEAVQNDSFSRAQITLESNWNRYQHHLRVTHRKESNIFADPFNGINNRNVFGSLQLQSEHEYLPSPVWSIKYGLSYENIEADTDNYLQTQRNDTWMAYINPTYIIPRTPLHLDISLRYSQQNSSIAPPGGHATLQWILNGQSISLSYRQATRFPSLNDLHWRPGGNPDLKPEFSRQANLGHMVKKEWGQNSYTQNFNAFYKKVDNWILWAPTPQFIWQPDNLIKVTSTGFEYVAKWEHRLSMKHRIRLEGNFLYQYVRNTEGPGTPLAQEGRNLIYMPATKLNISLSYQVRGFEVTYLHHYRSKIYTRPNLAESLDPLQLGQCRLTYHTKIFGHQIQTFIQAYNAWDQSYFFQPNRPAPGRSWALGLFISNR